MRSPQITACIVSCDRYKLLSKALGSLTEQSLSIDCYEIMVVDTTVSEHRPPELETQLQHQGICYIKAGPVGLSNGRNLALEHSNTPLIAFIDDDAIAEKDWLENLLTIFQQQPKISVAGGPVIPSWETASPSWLPKSMQGYLTIVDWGEDEKELAAGEWLAGTNFALRITLAQAAGGFRGDLGRRGNILLSNEELDLCRRITQSGGRILYSPSVRVHHLVMRERCTQAWVRKRVAWQVISDLIMEPEAQARTESLFNSIDHFFAEIESDKRDPKLLFSDVNSPALFEAQCNAIRAYINLFGTDALIPS